MKCSVFIVAEIGSVHDGSFGNAKQAALLAKKCGADAVKYQVHIAEAETLPNAPAPPFFNRESRWDYFKRTAFTRGQWKELKQYCYSIGIEFMASPFSEAAVDLLQHIGIRKWKIPSGEVTNLPMLRKIARTRKPVILSSGMSSWKELDAAVKAIRSVNRSCSLTLLQCTSEYPCQNERVGINVMEEMAGRYDVLVGLSDHTLDIFASVVAVSRGAVVIEKHLTFSRQMYGSDARHSLEPVEFGRMVEGIRAAEAMLGSRLNKADTRRWTGMKRIFEKSIVLRKDLPAGTRLSRDHLDFKKPGTGIAPSRMGMVVGRMLRRGMKRNVLLSERDLVSRRSLK